MCILATRSIDGLRFGSTLAGCGVSWRAEVMPTLVGDEKTVLKSIAGAEKDTRLTRLAGLGDGGLESNCSGDMMTGVIALRFGGMVPESLAAAAIKLGKGVSNSDA